MSSADKTCPMCGANITGSANACADCGERLPVKVNRSKWPIVVRLSLLGLRTRASAWAFVWLSVLIALSSTAYGWFDSRFFVIGPLFVLAAIAYYLALRWVDRNSSWS